MGFKLKFGSPFFFSCLIPGVVVKSSERLDEHMNPLQELQVLRKLLNDKKTTNLVSSLRKNHSKLKVHIADSHHDIATDQYSLGNAPQEVDSQEQKDWLRFLKDAHKMSDEDVKREIKTPAVLEAFELARLVTSPEDVKDGYIEQEIRFENMSTFMRKWSS